MGFYINYSQIRSYFLRMDNRIDSLGALLDVMDVAWDEILNEESMQGKAAEAIKTYIREFHKPVIRSIKVLLEEFYDKMLLYMEDYYAHIDAGADTVLGEDGFAAYEELMDMDLNKLSYWDQELERILDSIRGYCDISKPDLGGLETVNRSLTMRMRHLPEDTAAMEAAHMEDTEGPEELVESIRKVIADNAWQAQALENVYEIPAVDSAELMHMNSISGRENGMMHTVEMEERLSEALQSERVRRLEERRQGGIEQGIYGAECMLIGGYAIVATGGAAVPIYVTALAAGTGSIAYGFSELAEGVHNYELGSRGDLETASYNILRDEVFFGDQACYDTFGRTAVFISGVIPTVSSLYEWGCSRSVSGEVSGGDAVPEGGTGTQGYSNFADGMSPEDAARYIANNEAKFFEEFSERARAAGLSDTQISEAYSAMRSGDYTKMASYFDTSSPVDGAVFWSGNKEGAAAYANSIGGTIMEQTPGGQVFDNWRGLQGMYPEWDTMTNLNQKPIWNALSSQYANGVEGMATYVHPSGYEGKVWLNIEKPILEENDIIIQEVIIDAK